MKIKFKRVGLEYVFFVLYIAFILNVPNSIFQTSYDTWLPYFYVLPNIFLTWVHYVETTRVKKDICDILRYFIAPIIIVSLVAAITAHWVYHNDIATMNSLKKALDVCVAYMFGYYLVRKFKKQTIGLIIIAGVLTYSTVIVRFILAGGRNPFGAANGITLEVHTLTYIFSMVFIALLLDKKIKKEIKKILCIICFVGIVLGNKRALYLAMGIALFVYYLFHKVLQNKSRGLKVVAIISVASAIIWVWMIHSGIFEALTVRLGVKDNSRLLMWNYFKNDYSVSINYWGKGLTYTDIIMGKIYKKLQFSHAITIHNDILRSFIGWGFIPFCYYIFICMYSRIVYFVKQKKIEDAWRFLAVSVVYFVINFFGNTFFTPSVCIVYFVVWYDIVFKEEQLKYTGYKKKFFRKIKGRNVW